MTRPYLLIAFISLIIAGCQPDSDLVNSSPKPDSGIDYQGMDTNVSPQDDFFNYMNGTWLETTEIPADKSGWGSFSTLRDNSLHQLKAIVTEIDQQPATELSTQQQQIKALYQSYTNQDAIQAMGLEPLEELLDAIEQINSPKTLGQYLARTSALGIKSPIGFWVDQNAKNTEEYMLYFTQSGLGLPDRDYYFDDSERGQSIREGYQRYITRLFEAAQINAPDVATSVVQLETQLAEKQWTRVENRNRDKTYNRFTMEAFQTLMGEYPISPTLTLNRLNRQEAVIVRQPDYFESLGQIINSHSLDDWKLYLSFHLLNSFASYLSGDFEAAQFDFYGKQLRGVEVQEPRWKRAIQFINGGTGELLGQLYVEKHFPEASKQRMGTLVQHLTDAYRESIQNLDWMTEETKGNALKKLSMFTPKIGYPDQWRNYSDLLLNSETLVANVVAVRLHNHYYELGKLGQPINRDEWFMPPQIVNAYYNSSMNEIVFPAAILQPPFFSPEADDAVNYGAIGGVIGHEIGHGFDDQGSKSDGHGTLTNWWTDQDRKAFDSKAQQLAEQYGQFEVLPGQFVNGKLTLGENIGDLGGLSIALKAYHLSLAGEPAPVIDGFTGEQRVFMGWAQMWRTKRREETQLQLLKTAPHSPPRYRVNGVVRNIDAFYDAFDVKEGDALYLPPEQRVSIW